MRCVACGSRDIDFHEAGGHSYCVSCGNIVEESAIVSSIEFQENGDRSQVIGQFVAANCSRPYSASSRTKGRFGTGRDSRDITIFKMKQIIMQIASSLNMPEDGITDRALALYQIAMEKNFVFGRRQIHVASTCLYAMCRKEAKPHLLIDFSDALQVNIYILGKSFLQFIRLLNLKLPIIDPSLYIHRFALRLEVGEKINSVITIALRIVTRMKKDWIVMGRRPDGICAAAMLVSSRAHGFPATQSEVAKIFRISADTVKHRLDDFRATPSAQLSVTQFSQHDSTVEFDPPSYIRNLLADNVTSQPVVMSLEEEGAENTYAIDDSINEGFKETSSDLSTTNAAAATATTTVTNKKGRKKREVSGDGDTNDNSNKDKTNDDDEDDDDDDDERDEDYKRGSKRSGTRRQQPSRSNKAKSKDKKKDKKKGTAEEAATTATAPIQSYNTATSVIDGVRVQVPVPGSIRRRGPSNRTLVRQREKEVFYEDFSAELDYTDTRGNPSSSSSAVISITTRVGADGSQYDEASATNGGRNGSQPQKRRKRPIIDTQNSTQNTDGNNNGDEGQGDAAEGDDEEEEEVVIDVDGYILDEEETQKK